MAEFFSPYRHQFVRIGACVPQVAIAEPAKNADQALALVAASKKLAPVFVVGAPLRREGRLYNCGLAIHRGRLLGVVPKVFLPNYREFYERRHFTSGEGVCGGAIAVGGHAAPFGVDLIFAAS